MRVRQGLAAACVVAGMSVGCASLHTQAPTVEPTAVLVAQPIPMLSGPIWAAQRIEETLAKDPNVVDVLRCDTPGAERLLVHVRQSHFLEPEVADKNEPDVDAFIAKQRQGYSGINAVQCRIHDALISITNAIGTRVVMMEGLSEEPALENIAKEYYRTLDVLDRHGYIDAPVPDGKISTYARIEEELPSRFPMAQDRWPAYGCIPGAAFLLALNNRITLAPAETRESEKKAYEGKAAAIAADDPRPWDRVEIMDDREDAVLLRATQVPTPVSIVVYGAGHAFGGKRTCGDAHEDTRKSYRDNIADWNERHPDERFSLLEVTVRGLKTTIKDR